MPLDLVVVGQDPRFGGGALAQTNAFLEAAEALGRTPTLLYDPHPGLGDTRWTWRRVEALRQLRAARRLEAPAREARSLWVVATLAHHGGAAARTGRPYACWLGTTIDSEWNGRAPGLPPGRRVLAGASIRRLRDIERGVLAWAEGRLYATSPASRASVATAAGLAEDEVRVLPIPVDVEHFTQEPDETWLGRLDAPLIGFVGRADDPRKNAGLLLGAFARVRDELPGARLRLIGAPPRELVGPGVEATGVVADVAPLLRECALLVSPSREEGFGIGVAEALACGVPAVVTPSGGPEELVRDSGGGRVTEGWAEKELADTVLDLLADRTRLAELRRAGREYVAAEHSPGRFRQLLAGVLEELDGYVAAVVGNYEGAALLPECLASLDAQTQRPVEVIVVDAASNDASVEVATTVGARVLVAPNRGLGFLYNRGVEVASADHVLLLNNDVALEPDCLALLAAELDADERRFAADPTQLDWAGERVIHARTTLSRGRLTHEYLPGLHLDPVVPADRVTPTVCANGAAMLVRRSLFTELGGFDETFFLEWEDLDLCWRAWMRQQPTVYVPRAVVRHRVGAVTTAAVVTRRSASSHHNLMRFALKCLPWRSAARVVAGELVRVPAHPRVIPSALASIVVELPEILAVRRALRPDAALLACALDGMRKRPW